MLYEPRSECLEAPVEMKMDQPEEDDERCLYTPSYVEQKAPHNFFGLSANKNEQFMGFLNYGAPLQFPVRLPPLPPVFRMSHDKHFLIFVEPES